MALPNIFSRRLRQQRSIAEPDVYVYDKLPTRLRIQITQVWVESLGLETGNDDGLKIIQKVVRMMRKEKGVYHLTGEEYEGWQDELFHWFINEDDIGRCLDAVEIVFQRLDEIDGHGRWVRAGVELKSFEAIEELNARFLESGIGYQYESGFVIRVDSQLVHAAVVKPVLSLLRDPAYTVVNTEFLEAHRLYRAGEYEKSLTECCKSFESTLKVIINRRGWAVAANATVKPLLDVVFTNGLIPEYGQSGFNSIRALLEGSIATIRNRSSGHGAGTTPRIISRHLAGYQLHQTASAILFLVDSEKARP